MLVIVIGRGHGGTRIISSTLSQSNVYMGPTNDSGDMVPAKLMYEAVKMAGAYVSMVGENNWDFTKLILKEPPKEFEKLVNDYISPLKLSNNDKIGWKLPETLLAFPWIIKMFPEAYYIHWTRDPRDAVLKYHLTDRLSDFNIPSVKSYTANRIESWIYQRQLVDATPKPTNFIEIKFEDFVLRQDETLDSISNFIGVSLVKIPVIKERVGNYKQTNTAIPRIILDKYGYE